MASHRRRSDPDDAAAPFTLEEPGLRAARLEHLIFEEVDRLFRMEIRDRHLQQVTITSLHLSPDLRNAKVYFALGDAAPRAAGRDPREQAALQALLRVTPFLRARVAEALSMKRTPDLHFHRDRMAEASLRAEAVLMAERAAARPAQDAAPEPAPAPAPAGDEAGEGGA